ncbi:VOC family protein [Arachidicoccus ginsenosidivorans]|uniref:VOC family protein n=1 Tax=Arachidicoccus ginsenosidivorans TaxID=496057 RepID=A0A5B8VMX3_9BACT|nr:VOC family protein [Arachidicoccus ginsenosidivorans]QEC72421.1 VOC family protein [Arachidicoccus ginsenosidivorans]
MRTSEICLWFDGNAEEAIAYYGEIIKELKVISKFYTEIAPPRQGSQVPLTIEFEMAGIRYMALNGGNAFKFTPAISIMLLCETQQQIDTAWEHLAKDGQTMQCGWLTDKFGISWQIVPAEFSQWLLSKEPGKSDRVMQAMMQMVKLDLETLKNA